MPNVSGILLLTKKNENKKTKFNFLLAAKYVEYAVCVSRTHSWGHEQIRAIPILLMFVHTTN